MPPGTKRHPAKPDATDHFRASAQTTIGRSAIVLQGMHVPVEQPVLAPERRLQARAVPPRSRGDGVQWKSALGQEIPHPRLGPAGAVVRIRVHLVEEWRDDQEMAARLQHLQDIAARLVWPQHVLEDVLGDDQIERSRQRIPADVECRVLSRRIGSESETFPHTPGYFEGAESRRIEPGHQPPRLFVGDLPGPERLLVPGGLPKPPRATQAARKRESLHESLEMVELHWCAVRRIAQTGSAFAPDCTVLRRGPPSRQIATRFGEAGRLRLLDI